MKWSRPLFIVAFLVASTGTTVAASEYTEETRELADNLVEEPDPELKATGFLTIGHLGTDEQRARLEEFRNEGGAPERLAVGTALVMSGADEATSFAAERALASSEPRQALTQMEIHLDDESMNEIYNAALEEAHDRHRDAIFSVLATRTDPLYDNLAGRLTADDEEERSAALEALLATAGAETLEKASALTDHGDPEIRRQIFEIVDAVDHRSDLRSSVVELLGEMTEDADEDIRYRAAHKLVALGEQQGVEFLVDRLSEADSERRVESLEWLLEHDAEADIEEVRPMIQEVERAMTADDAADRDRELQLLYEFAATDSDDQLVEDLRQKFTSTDFDERLASVRSLGRTGRPKVKQQLLEGLGEGRSDIRRLSARGLGQLGDKDVLSDLQVALRSETDQDVKLELIETVGKIRDPEAANVLRFMVTDEDPEVRMGIVEALGKIGLPETSRALGMLARDRNDEIAWRAFIELLELDPDEARSHVGSVLRNPPEDFGDHIRPGELTDEGVELLYNEILTHSTSKVYSVGVEHAVAYPDRVMPIARDLLTSSDLDEQARREVLLLIADRVENRDLASFDRIVQLHRDEPAGRLAAWYLAKRGDDTFEETFKVLVEDHEVGDDPTPMYVIANLALANMQ